MSATEDERLLRRYEDLHLRVEVLKLAENKALGSPMSRCERACRKATRDAYQLVLDMMNEGVE
jgi:hypothetical protein